MDARIFRGLTGPTSRRRALFGAVVLGLVAASGIFASVMVASYRDVSREVSTVAANLASAVSHDVDRNIELLDLSLQAVTDQWTNPAIQAMDGPIRDAVLFDRSVTAEDYGRIYVLDRDGKVLADSRHTIPTGTSFADRDYFRVHVANTDVGLFVSKPSISRVTGNWFIAFSRRLGKPGSDFSGVAVATLNLSYFSKLYKGLNLGRDDTVTLLRTDGRIVTREPYVETDIRRSVWDDPTFNAIRAPRSGSLEAPSPVDGRTRIISFHRVGNLPLIQDVEVSVDAAYADWWRKTTIVAAILGALGVSTVALLVMLNAELGRRAEVEAVLERLVATDPLTEVANRRRFENALDVEWRRSIREGSPVSLLMIDADRFKAYNDTYGHPAGDLLLKALAVCIAGNVRRPGDLVARYGGEEFAVLLPSTAAEGAAKVADSVRAAVAALAYRHEGAAIGIATVSIGAASADPMLGQPSADMVAAADAALYRAKADGRNCVRVAPASSPVPAQDLIFSRAAA